VPKASVPVEIVIGDQRQSINIRADTLWTPPTAAIEPPAAPSRGRDWDAVPLIRLALARSGDKGDHANIGVIARRAGYLPYIAAALSADAVQDWFAHLLAPQRGRVERWYLPGTASLNFMLYHALGGGGAASLRTDPQGKALAQMLLEFPVPVPPSLIGD
jgi:hypothetical protein